MARKRKGGSRGGLIIGLSVAAVILVALIVWLILRLISAFNSDVSGTTVRVPDIVGKPQAEAVSELKRAQLEGREAPGEYNDDVPKGHVYEQDPEPGMLVKPGRTVRYYVSAGKARFVVPDLRGKSLDDAAQALRKAGLALGAVQRVYLRGGAAGRIVNQSPGLGEEFTSPISVDVIVADTRNLPRVAMPDLFGIALPTAEELLTRADLNLQLALVEYVGSEDVAAGTILAQQPAAGEQVEMATRVGLQVAVPSAVKNNPHKRLTLRIPVPAGPPQQQVIIKVADELGERIDFSESKKPGEIVERTVDVQGSATVRIFVGDEKEPIREEKI
jgi:serine/threonine-protein kinase